MGSSNFKSTLPGKQEMLMLTPAEGSRRVVQAFKEAMEELVRQGKKPMLTAAAELLGVSSSSYQSCVTHLQAVDLYNISPMLSKQEAIRRLRLMEPVVRRLSPDLEEARESRSDPEILADAVSNLIIRASQELTGFDTAVIRGFLMRDPKKRGATKSALIDFIRWLHALEAGL